MSENGQTPRRDDLAAQLREQRETLARLCAAVEALTAEVARLRESRPCPGVAEEEHRRVVEERDKLQSILDTLAGLPLVMSEEALANIEDDGPAFAALITELEQQYGNAP